VWVATHLTLDTEVAIKFMHMAVDGHGTPSNELGGNGPASSAVSRARFELEAKTAAQIRSVNVVQILDYGVDRGAAYIVMELLQGHDLDQRLRRSARLSVEESAKIVIPLLQVLQRSHDAGMVHRDLKPANIFLAEDGDAEVPKVLDFGVAKAVHRASVSEITEERTLIGTPHYASPEQLKNSAAIDGRADLWSMGVVFFRMVTGRKPFRSVDLIEAVLEVCGAPVPKVATIAEDLPPELDAFFARALHRDVDARFQSAREMAQAIGELVEAIAKRGAQGPASDGAAADRSGGFATVSQSNPLAQTSTGSFVAPGAKRRAWLMPALVAVALGVAAPIAVVMVRRQTPPHAAPASEAAAVVVPGAAAPTVPFAAASTTALVVQPVTSASGPSPIEAQAPAASSTPRRAAPGDASWRSRNRGGRATPSGTAGPKRTTHGTVEDKEVGY
jgi:serine/threonine-protein kinase